MILAHAQLRELGAEKLRFESVKRAVIWYRREAARRIWRCTVMELEIGRIPFSTEDRNRNNATFAAIAVCLKGIEHIPWLVGWYEGDGWGDGTWLAEQAGMTRWRFQRRCRKTERELRRRLESADLMESPSG